ncbi:MAG: hypothetical protein IJJ63_02030 [Bacilli bacterium]|nr:hypothetical protein [Bacilli bacterium]
MNNIIFKDIDIEKEELPVRRSYQYSNIRLNTYKVTEISTDYLLAINTDKQSYPSNLNLVDYINKIYMQTTRKSNISGEYSVGYVSYDGNYLTIVENSSNINSLIHKSVFDVRDIKIPKTTLQQLDELQKYSKYSFQENLVSRYAPIIHNIISDEIPSIIKDDNNKNDFYYYFFTSKDNIKQINKGRTNPYPILFSVILLNSLLFSSPYGYASPIVKLLYGVETGYLSAEFALFLKKKQNSKEILNKGRGYRDQCSNLIDGDLKTYEEVIQKVAKKALDLKIYNNDFYVNASKDMLVLNCYNDQSINETKLELLSLICEYIQFHSIKRKDHILEELFNNKLKELEERIDLSNLKPYYQDEDTIDFLSFYCEPDNNNYYSKLIPIEYDSKMTYEKMKLIQKEEEKEKIKVK